MKLSVAASLAVLGVAQASPIDFMDAIMHVPYVPQTLWNFPWPPWGKKEVDSEKLQELIDESALRERAEKLYEIAQTSEHKFGHPTRVIDSPGHWATIRYILSELGKLDPYYNFDVQKFNATVGHVNSYSLLIDGEKPKSLGAFSMTPGTHGKAVDGNLVLVENHGCSLSDFPKHTKGSIVLIERGECAFQNKSINAGKLGAVGAIIFDKDGLSGTLGEPTGEEVPTVSITTKDAKKYIDVLSKKPHHKFETTLFVDAFVKTIRTINVVAETRDGDHDNVVSLGAHSDSVAEGPGINDDGSGTISLLEVAKQLTKFKVNNAVRFAWWAAEEEGLLGSYAYANSLSPKENKKLRLFMDYDMMASPNFDYEVYDANNKDHPAGSGDLKELYIKYYKDHGLNYTLVPFDGRSDYVGFIDQGIPAGGVATGAEKIKTKKGQEQFGGHAGEWFDPCYHQLCDDLSNPNYTAWMVNTRLIAHSVATYAKSLEGFPEREEVKALGAGKISDLWKYRGSHLII